MNLGAGPLSLAATSLILVSPFTKFALTLEPVARGVEEFVQKVWLLYLMFTSSPLLLCFAHVMCLCANDSGFVSAVCCSSHEGLSSLHRRHAPS